MSSRRRRRCLRRRRAPRARPLTCAAALAALAAPPTAPAQDPGTRGPRSRPGQVTTFGENHALLIGINRYPSQYWSDLRSPVTDIANIRDVLTSKYGYRPDNVVSLIDEHASRLGILEALKASGTKAARQNLLVYYAGHGALDEAAGTGYWVPHDGEGDNTRKNWIPVEEIKETIRLHLDVHHLLLVSDSCFSGAFTRGRTDAEIRKFHEALARESSAQVFTSGGLMPVQDSSVNGMSPFAYHLYNHLKKNQQRFTTILELAHPIMLDVFNDARIPQTPELGILRGMDTKFQRGQFVFENVEQNDDRSVPAESLGPLLGWKWPRHVQASRVEGSANVYHVKTPTDECQMVLVKSDPDRGIHTPFLIDRTEVTVSRFSRFLASYGRVRRPRSWKRPGYAQDAQPVVHVDLETAEIFANWAVKELPRETHWEHAAAFDPAAGGQRRYPWGTEFADGAVSFERTPYPPEVPPELGPGNPPPADVSPWGVVGTGSGVREWCVLSPDVAASKIDGAIRGAASFGTELATRSPEEWAPTDREQVPRTSSRNNLGFRCVIFLTR